MSNEGNPGKNTIGVYNILPYTCLHHAYLTTAGLWRIPFLAHSFFSYFLTTFLCNSFFLTTFLQKYIFSSFEGQKLVISRPKNSRNAGPFFLLYCAKIVRFILTTFFKVFQILLYGMQKCRCSRIWLPGYGYHHTAGHSYIFLLFNYFFIMNIPSF